MVRLVADDEADFVGLDLEHPSLEAAVALVAIWVDAAPSVAFALLASLIDFPRATAQAALSAALTRTGLGDLSAFALVTGSGAFQAATAARHGLDGSDNDPAVNDAFDKLVLALADLKLTHLDGWCVARDFLPPFGWLEDQLFPVGQDQHLRAVPPDPLFSQPEERLRLAKAGSHNHERGTELLQRLKRSVMALNLVGSRSQELILFVVKVRVIKVVEVGVVL